MKNWMHQLIEHYQRAKMRTNGDVLILFDIDGTILDLRHTLLQIFRQYDTVNDTQYFRGLSVADVPSDEDNLEDFFRSLTVSPQDLYSVICWYHAKRWSSYALLRSAEPIPEVFELIAWFHQQPRTFVGLNSGRPESLRVETMYSVNNVAARFGIHFPTELVYLNQESWPLRVTRSKVQGIRHFQQRGYFVFAMVDNEMSNLSEIAGSEVAGDTLLLCAGNEKRGRAMAEEPLTARVPDLMFQLVGRSPALPLPLD